MCGCLMLHRTEMSNASIHNDVNDHASITNISIQHGSDAHAHRHTSKKNKLAALITTIWNDDYFPGLH